MMISHLACDIMSLMAFLDRKAQYLVQAPLHLRCTEGLPASQPPDSAAAPFSSPVPAVLLVCGSCCTTRIRERICRRFDVRGTGNAAPAAVRHLYACTPSADAPADAPAGKPPPPRAAHARAVEAKWHLLARLMRTVMFNQVR